MAYPQQAEQVAVSQQRLQTIAKTIEELNTYQNSNINEIEDKLHQILNLRSPNVIGKDNQPPRNISDYCSGLEEQIEFMRNNNERLIKIREHLNQII